MIYLQSSPLIYWQYKPHDEYIVMIGLLLILMWIAYRGVNPPGKENSDDES